MCVFAYLAVCGSWNDQAGLLWLPQMGNTWIVMIPSFVLFLTD